MSDIDTGFFLKFNNAEKVFSDIFRQAKKSIILQDQEDFLESMGEYITEKHKLSPEEANDYADLLFRIWEEKSFSSITAFDQEMTSLKKQLFKKED
ncbi:MAG: hypothetical protein HYS70_04810 [Nitrospinae bacterium]|nr:hypothetical protein [Nitrospinota bacterium]